MLIPTLSSLAVARNSPVLENARALHGLLIRTASIKCPEGRSHTRSTEPEAAIIHRPSLEKHWLTISKPEILP